MPTIEVSQWAFDYLKKNAEPLTDTTVTVVDRLLKKLENNGSSAVGSQPAGACEVCLQFSGDNLPSVKFTTISNAEIEGKPANHKYWNNILEDVISVCIAKGVSAGEVEGQLQANIYKGEKYENGYRFVEAAGFSFQGLEANRACKNILRLAQEFGVTLDITVQWQEMDGAKYPGQKARLILP